MALISDFFITAEPSASHYSGGEGLATDDYCRFEDISPLQAGQFLALLRGDDHSPEHTNEFRLVSASEDSGNEETWTMSVPQDMLMRLSKLDHLGINNMAQRLSEETQAELGLDAKEFKPFVSQLVELSKRALASGKVMYLWNSL